MLLRRNQLPIVLGAWPAARRGVSAAGDVVKVLCTVLQSRQDVSPMLGVLLFCMDASFGLGETDSTLYTRYMNCSRGVHSALCIGTYCIACLNTLIMQVYIIQVEGKYNTSRQKRQPGNHHLPLHSIFCIYTPVYIYTPCRARYAHAIRVYSAGLAGRPLSCRRLRQDGTGHVLLKTANKLF